MGCKGMNFEDRRQWKHKMYTHWRDSLEQRLAGVNAALATLEQQMERDNKNPPGAQEGNIDFLSKEAFDNI